MGFADWCPVSSYCMLISKHIKFVWPKDATFHGKLYHELDKIEQPALFPFSYERSVDKGIIMVSKNNNDCYVVTDSEKDEE